MASSSISKISRQVRPILSSNYAEARRKVLILYKAWMRHVPYIVSDYSLVYTRKEMADIIRAEFMKHKHVTDIRVIDILVIKSQMEFNEVVRVWKTPGTLQYAFKDSFNPKPKDFMGKFLAGHE